MHLFNVYTGICIKVYIGNDFIKILVNEIILLKRNAETYFVRYPNI